MASNNIGKTFEQEFKECVPPDYYLYRLKDDTSGFYGVSNPCDYILFRSPYLFLVELKTHKGKSIPIAKIRPNQIQGIDKKCVKCRAYDLTEENSKLHKEFLVTEDGRVFYWRSLISKIELVDAEEEKQEVQEVVVDFREAKEVAKEVAKELTEKDSNWKWRVQVLKSEIRVWWGYLQYCDTEDSHFTIKMSDREDECGTDTDFMVARNEHDEYMTGRIVGVDECWQDGDLNTCVAGLLRGIATIAHSRY